jgi:branched-chain amino acid transport system permease protein
MNTVLFISHLVTLTLVTAGILAGQRFLLFNCGVLCLATASFYALGAYLSVIFNQWLGTNAWLGVAGAVTVVAVFAVTVGYPLLRYLKGDFFALATLGIAQVTFVALRALAPGGSAGLAGIPPLKLLELPQYLDALLISVLFAAAAFGLVGWICASSFGKLVAAVRMDENALTAHGFSVTSIKLQVFVLAGMLAATGGALNAHHLGTVEPRLASIQHTVLLLCGTILSSGRPVIGPLVGAVFLSVLPEVLQMMLARSGGGAWQVFPALQVAYGMLVVVVALVFGGRVPATALQRSAQ